MVYGGYIRPKINEINDPKLIKKTPTLHTLCTYIYIDLLHA